MAELKNSTKRQLVNTSTLGVGVVLVLVIFVIANYFGWKYHKRLDWTSDKLYTLSEKSTQVLEALDKDVEVVVFMSPADPLFGSVSELLGSYEVASPNLSVRYLDVEKNLAEAQSLVDKYEVASLNVVVFDGGDDRRVVDATDLADYDYSGMQFGQQPEMTGFKGEQEFTSAIIDLVESRKPRVLFTAGHGELDLDDFSPDGISLARELLGKDNFELESWSTVGEQAVPEGTDLLVVAGPTVNFIEPEVALLRTYIEGGGRMLFLIDPTLAPTGGLVATGLEPLLEEYGVRLRDDIVVDPANPLPFFSADTIFVTAYAEHDITRSLSQAQLPVILGLARSVGMGEPMEELKVTELMMTSVEGWGETDLEHGSSRSSCTRRTWEDRCLWRWRSRCSRKKALAPTPDSRMRSRGRKPLKWRPPARRRRPRPETSVWWWWATPISPPTDNSRICPMPPFWRTASTGWWRERP
ncbi:MAG: hypothetical protein EP299_01960 [Acidobacteria bacterium]|nr:MAG: hypothetical protein EP299_01960 [Acidobacteriota bacterium]